MRKLLIFMVLSLSTFALYAQRSDSDMFLNGEHGTYLRPAVAIRMSGDMTLLGVKFDKDDGTRFNPRPFLGGTGTLGAAYEHPIAPTCAVAAGAGVSYGKAFMNDTRDNAFFSYFTMTTIYLEAYYALRLKHFYCNVGLRGGYTPLCTTEYPNGKNTFRGRMNNNHYTSGNVWGLIQAGYTTGRVDIGLDFNYALLSHFKEGLAYPVISEYKVVRTMYMNVGINVSYRIFVGK